MDKQQPPSPEALAKLERLRRERFTDYQLLRAAVRAYPRTDWAPRDLIRRNRIKYIEARLKLGDRALAKGGAFTRKPTVLV